MVVLHLMEEELFLEKILLEKGKIVPANLQVEVRSTAAAGPRAPPATAPLRAASHR